MNALRLRQLVIACESQDSYHQLQSLLGLGEPFHDPGVSEFGLHNAVFAIGDQFLEIIVPMSDAAPARRFIERSGEGGYMAIFQTNDLNAARKRIADEGIRSVWNADLDDIAATHLHPADIGGAIVSIDQAIPPESWRWAGKGWEDRSVPGQLTGAELTSPNPGKLAAKWSVALGLSVGRDTDQIAVALDDGQLEFSEGVSEKLQSFCLAVPEPDKIMDRAKKLGLSVTGQKVEFAGVSLVLQQMTA